MPDSASETIHRRELVSEKTPEERVFIHNETPQRLILKGDRGSIITLAPLERARLKRSTLENFNLRPLEEKNLLRLVECENTSGLNDRASALLGFALLFTIAGLVAFRHSGRSYWHIGSAVWYWGLGSAGLSLAFVILYLLKEKGLFARAMRAITRFLWLCFIAVLGIGLPAAAIYFFGAGRTLLAEQNPELLLLGRLLQCLFIAIAALLPALLYFLFDRQCLITLRSKFEHCIFRLDPNMHTLTDVRAKYGRQADEVYGDENARHGRMPLNVGSHFPILTATLLISMGWLMTFAPVGATKCEGLLTLFVPQRGVLTFGFLGAYFFAITDVLRRYVRRDLKPKAYSAICVRILVVVILAWVLGELARPGSASTGPRWATLGLIFLVGIFPETGLTYIREALPKIGKLFGPIRKEEEGALTNLDGIDLYDRTRLMDEGVTNIESLAHYDLIELMMETRIPVPRLIDWVDQAILYLHLKEQQPNAQQETGERITLHRRLQTYGIRTATDLLFASKVARGNLDDTLETLSPTEPHAKVNRLRVVIDSLSDDEWLAYVKNWRRKLRVPEQTIDAGSGAPSIQGCRLITVGRSAVGW
jgi:hypothetical protein